MHPLPPLATESGIVPIDPPESLTDDVSVFSTPLDFVLQDAGCAERRLENLLASGLAPDPRQRRHVYFFF